MTAHASRPDQLTLTLGAAAVAALDALAGATGRTRSDVVRALVLAATPEAVDAAVVAQRRGAAAAPTVADLDAQIASLRARVERLERGAGRGA